LINFRKTTSASGERLSSVSDYLLWYAKDPEMLKARQLFRERTGEGWVNYNYVRLSDGTHRRMRPEESTNWKLIPKGARIYRRDNLTSQRFTEDFPFSPLSNLWDDTLTGGYAEDRHYVVQTITKVVQRCLLMTTD